MDGYSAYALIGDGIFVLIVLLALFLGYHKGFMGMLVGILSIFIVVIASTLLCGTVASLLDKTFDLTAKLSGSYTNAFNFEDAVFTTPIKDLTQEQIVAALETLKLPPFINDAIANFAQAQIEASSIDAELTLQAFIVDNLAMYTVKLIAWMGLFVVLWVVFSLLKKIFGKKFNEIPIIGPINKLLGGVAGAILSVFFVSLAMYIFIMLHGIIPPVATEYIQSTALLKWIYNSNPVAYLISIVFTK